MKPAPTRLASSTQTVHTTTSVSHQMISDGCLWPHKLWQRSSAQVLRSSSRSRRHPGSPHTALSRLKRRSGFACSNASCTCNTFSYFLLLIAKRPSTDKIRPTTLQICSTTRLKVNYNVNMKYQR